MIPGLTPDQEYEFYQKCEKETEEKKRMYPKPEDCTDKDYERFLGGWLEYSDIADESAKKEV